MTLYCALTIYTTLHISSVKHIWLLYVKQVKRKGFSDLIVLTGRVVFKCLEQLYVILLSCAAQLYNNVYIKKVPRDA